MNVNGMGKHWAVCMTCTDALTWENNSCLKCFLMSDRQFSNSYALYLPPLAVRSPLSMDGKVGFLPLKTKGEVAAKVRHTWMMSGSPVTAGQMDGWLVETFGSGDNWMGQ